MKQRINPYIRFNRTAQGPYAQRIAVESYGKTFFQGACFRVVSATIGDPSPIQTVVCFNEPPDEATCGVVHPDSDFWFFNNGGNMNVEAYSGSGPGANCLTFDTEDTTEGDGISGTDVVTMDYALNTPGACHKSGESDPDCILSQIISYPVTNKIYHVTTATVPYTNPSLVVVEFDSALGTIGTNWLVVVNSVSVTISDASIVNGDLHFTLAVPIVETDVVTLRHTSLTGGAVAVDGRGLYQFIDYPVDNEVDETAPSVPDNFSATPVWYDQVDLAWDASTDAGSGVKEYIIYRDFVEIDRVAVPTLTYSDTGLTGGTAYTYTVTAEDNAGNESTGATPDIATTFNYPPQATEGEVGQVADNIPRLTYDVEVFSSDFTVGMSFTEDGSPRSIVSAAKVSPTEIQYTLSQDISNGTTVVFTYDANVGDYANSDGVPSESDSNSIINNVAPPVTDPDFHAYGADINGQIRGLVLGDGSLTFARSSAATVTDWEGLVKTVLEDELRFKNARRVENLVDASEDFSGWSKSVAVATGVSDPDGGSTAVTLTASANNEYLLSRPTVIDGLDKEFRNSLWLKRRTGTGDIFVYKPDDTNEVVTLTGSWQRFATTITAGRNATQTQIGVIIGVSGDEVDFWHPQGEDVTGQANQNPSEYVSVGVESGDYHGVGVDGVAVFAYENGNTVASNIVTEAKGSDLTTDWKPLYEPAATNLTTYSEELDNAAWTKTNVTVDADVTAAPNGVDTADRINVDATGGTHSVYRVAAPPGVTGSVPVTASCYLKDDGTTYGGVCYFNNGAYYTVIIDLTDGSFADSTSSGATNTSYNIETLDDGWYRVSVTATMTGTLGYVFACCSDSGSPSYSGGRPTYTGIAGNDMFAWGAQQEDNTSVVTSYIPTSGDTANRTADDGDGAFAYSNWNQTEGTLIFDLVMEEETNQGIFNVANAEAGVLSFDTVNEFQTDDGTNQANVDPTLASNLGDTIRFAIDYKTNLVVGYKNITDAGSWVWDTDSASYDGTFATNSVINIFHNLATVSQIKDIYYYNTEQGKAFVEANY